MKTLKLQYPVTFGTETITELKLRRPTGKDLRDAFDAHEGEWGRIIALGATLSGRAPAEIESLDGLDAMALREEINRFLTGSKDPAAKG